GGNHANRAQSNWPSIELRLNYTGQCLESSDSPHTSGHQSHTSHVLYVGDDGHLARVMQDVLSADGFHVRRVPHADADRDFANIRRSRVAILDWSSNDGLAALQFAHRVRAHHPATGVMLCTEQQRFAERWRVLIEACDDYLTKPCAPNDLLARVRMLSAKST